MPRRAKPQNPQIGSVLVVDIVRWSVLPADVQALAIDALTRELTKCPTFARAVEAKTAAVAPSGDGMMIAFFEDLTAPLRLACEVKARMGKLPFKVRMGIHVGPVAFVERDVTGSPNIAGDGVVMAARVTGIAHPGEIVLTGRAREIFSETTDLEVAYADLGETSVKHGVPVQAFLVLDDSAALRAERDQWRRFLPKANRLLARNKGAGDRRAADPETVARRLFHLRRDLFRGLLLVGVALVGHQIIRRLDFGEKLELWAYEKLQGQLSVDDPNPQVVVVDIRKDFDDASNHTKLAELYPLVAKIAHDKPAAIGIDIDFGPVPLSELPPGSQEVQWPDAGSLVTDQALALTQTGTPVFLGVQRGLSDSRDMWLGNIKYARLAAHVERPKDALNGQMYMLGALLVKGHRIPSLAGALAAAYEKSRGEHRVRSWWAAPYAAPFAETLEENPASDAAPDPDIVGHEQYLNPAAYPSLLANTFIVPKVNDPSRSFSFAGKVVVIGSSDPKDVWHLPTSTDDIYGVYYHALAAYTEIFAPAYRFNVWVEWLLNALAAGFVLVASLGVRRMYVTEFSAVNADRITVATMLVAVALALVAGILLVRYLSVLWTDFFLVSLLIVLHPRIEHSLERAWHAIWGGVVGTWRKLLFAGVGQ